jgi:hypothetical protein
MGYSAIEGIYWTFPICDLASCILSFTLVMIEFRKEAVPAE